MIDDDDDNDYSSVSWRSTYKCCYYIIMIKANQRQRKGEREKVREIVKGGQSPQSMSK